MDTLSIKAVRESIQEENEVTVEEFTARIDCARSTWYRIESGQTKLTMELANRIAREFGEKYLPVLRECCRG